MMKRLSYQTMAECDCDSELCAERGYCIAERNDQLQGNDYSGYGRQWKSIDTAPRDGRTIIDLHDGNERRTDMIWEITSPLYPDGCWKKHYQSWEEAENFQAKYWMPIPPKPNQ